MTDSNSDTFDQLEDGMTIDRAEVEAHARDVHAHLARFDGHQMVVNLYAYAAMRFARNRAAYELPYVEYAALFYWHENRKDTKEPLTEEGVLFAYKKIGRLFMEVASLYHHDAATAKSNKDLEELALRAKHAGLMIRNPAFEVHHRTVLEGLFTPIAEDLRSALGFSSDEVIRIFSSVPDVLEDGRAAFREDVEAAREEQQEADFTQCFGDYFVLRPANVAKKAGLNVEVVRKVLDAFSLKYGEAGEYVLLPSPFSALREKPLLDLGDDRFLVPNPSLLISSIQPRVEDLINPAVTPGATAGLWRRYERHRGRWVEETCYALIQRMIPHGRGIIGAYYPSPTDGLQVEGDVVYEVDDLVVLVEAKAGAFTPATFRGAPGSLKNDIREVIQKGHDQTIRAQDYILAGNSVFGDEHGTPIFSLSGRPREILRIVVTLAPTDVFATSATILQRAGFMHGVATWVLPLTDLMILADCLSLPGELRYYARQRYDAILDERLLVFDETDFLGIYLSNNDMLLLPDEVADTIVPDFGVAEKLNRYYLYGEAKKPPRQSMALNLDRLIRALANKHDVNWTHAVCDLFGLSGASRDDMAQMIAQINKIKDGLPHDVSVGKAGKWSITITAFDNEEPRIVRQVFIRRIAPREEDTGKRLVIGYDAAGAVASGEYYKRVGETFYHIPPALMWTSAVRRN
jgi:hypothetical protein